MEMIEILSALRHCTSGLGCDTCPMRAGIEQRAFCVATLLQESKTAITDLLAGIDAAKRRCAQAEAERDAAIVDLRRIPMERLTFEGSFCDIAQCSELPCKHGGDCTQKEVWERLKQFEDVFKTPDKATWAKKTIEMAFSDDPSEVERLRELYKADKDGRVVVLPCKVGANMINQISKDCPRLMKNVRPAIVYVRKGVIYNMALETFEGAVSEGLIIPVSEEAEKAMKGDIEK